VKSEQTTERINSLFSSKHDHWSSIVRGF